MIIVVWIVLALVLGLVAKAKGDSFWGWTVAGLIVDPILGAIIYFFYRLMFRSS